MRKTVGNQVGVQASDGVRSLADLRKVVEAGATRVGASSGVKLWKAQNKIFYFCIKKTI